MISSDCGWRFLEAAPADLRVINGVPTIDSNADDYSSASAGCVFGYYRTEDNENNLYVNGTTTFNSSDCTGTAVGTGENNTHLLVAAMGEQTYSRDGGSSKTGNYAARLCDILEYTVNEVKYDDWFLPSQAELNLMYSNLQHIAGIVGIANNTYWSSSENSNDAYHAWAQHFGNESQNYNGYRYFNYGVRAVRTF